MGTGWRWVVVHRERRTRGPGRGVCGKAWPLQYLPNPQGTSRSCQPPISLAISTQGPRPFCFLSGDVPPPPSPSSCSPCTF